MVEKNIIGIIPARYGSTRFPGKPLADIFGKPMILRVVEQAEKSTVLSAVWVATDDEKIAEVVRAAGKNVIMTSADHPSGTDRCLEAVRSIDPNAFAVVNIQGDEPFVHVEQINALAKRILEEEVDIATLCKEIKETSVLVDPNKVKVVKSLNGKALYFSRQAIPYVKGKPIEDWLKHQAYFKHLGLYAYKTAVLESLAALAPSGLETSESLEQLRWLENGFTIFVDVTDWETPAIDTPGDLERLRNEGMPNHL